jgi:O-antigen/teichoic acid export membrane protein
VTTSSSKTASQAGRGVLWLSMAKIYFMGTGFLLVVFLPKLFEKLSGDTTGELYGRYRVVIGLINLLNMILIGGTIQAVSKFISERETRAHSVKWQTLKIQTVLGGSLSLALFLGADLIATHLYKQPSLAFYLRMAAPIVLLYSYYAVIIGSLNGLKKFFQQALMDILFASGKVGMTIAFVVAGYAISGAIGGFLVTAAIMLTVSTFVLGRLDKGEPFPWQAIWRFEWKTLFFAFFLNGLLQIDLQLLMALAPPTLGSPESQAGVYGLALQLGQLPYVATIAVAFVVFPLISRATFEADASRTRQYVSATNRYVFLFLAGLVATFASEAAGIMSLPFFPQVYASGSQMFAILSVGYLFFAMVVVSANIFTGSGRPITSALLFAGMLSVSALLNALLIPLYGGTGAAIASSIAMFCGSVAAGIISIRRFKTFLSPLSFLRGALAALVVALFAYYLEPGGTGTFWVLLRLASKFVLYCGVLIGLRELTRADLKQVLALRRA